MSEPESFESNPIPYKHFTLTYRGMVINCYVSIKAEREALGKGEIERFWKYEIEKGVVELEGAVDWTCSIDRKAGIREGDGKAQV